jgi:hypothetical protein
MIALANKVDIFSFERMSSMDYNMLQLPPLTDAMARGPGGDADTKGVGRITLLGVVLEICDKVQFSFIQHILPPPYWAASEEAQHQTCTIVLYF